VQGVQPLSNDNALRIMARIFLYDFKHNHPTLSNVRMQTVRGIFGGAKDKLSLGLKNILKTCPQYLAFRKLYRLILHLEVRKT
jgi:hypothetical protein